MLPIDYTPSTKWFLSLLTNTFVFTWPIKAFNDPDITILAWQETYITMTISTLHPPLEAKVLFKDQP
jgi:hypothetical protein